ncbi:hypothetical protein COCSADRAFT_253216 [Bipolaris sorokiniana ND90Pr]|uniref:Uncharacterized protein n=1 Tax=Cochliobolus sativus (strain ND90Pr / ATCC 201652) TaxID=665912 RepID=M2SRK8_COCSN|nr:uncharacterized protein COCSADRAFT_253216 [Bipolaris sorokiniana ND90Pr]EMD59721.1 hypothetical protein COCSADRAFT_253216 [Bipolaris sorokiniana ND90Pr]
MLHCVSSDRQIAESTGYTCTLIYICMMYVSTYILGGVRRHAHWLVRGRPGNGSSRSHSGRLLPTWFVYPKPEPHHNTDKPCHHTHPGHDCDAPWKRLTRLHACLFAFLVRVVNVNLISCGRCSVATLFSTWPLLPRLLLLILQQHHMDDLQHGRVCSGTCDSAMAPSSGSWFRIPYLFNYTLRPHPSKDFNTCGTRCRGLSQATHQAVRQAGY